jgi:hypothetical protein
MQNVEGAKRTVTSSQTPASLAANGFGGHMSKTLIQEFDGHQLWSSSGLRTDHNGLPLLCFSGYRGTNDGVGRDHTTVGEGGRCNAVTKRMIAAL